MKSELFATLSAMREELQESRLEVSLAPAPAPRHELHFVRVVSERNCLWYREFCARFPSCRIGVSKFKTAIRRRETLLTLSAMLAGEAGGPVYGPRLLDSARTYWKRNRAEIRERMEHEAATL